MHHNPSKLSFSYSFLIVLMITINHLYNCTNKQIFILIFIVYILICYIKKFHTLLWIIVAWFCWEIETIYCKDKLIVQYEIYNYYPNKNNKTNTYLYLAYDGKRKFLLRTYNKKEYFTPYKSLLYSVKTNDFFQMESVCLEEGKINRLKNYIYKWINSRCGSFKYNQYIQGVILGIREDKNLTFKHFKNTGTWHLLCVGGLHMGILKKFILFIISLLFGKKPNRVYPLFYYLQMIILSLYGYISGFQVPALRSVIMHNIDLFARIKHSYSPVCYRYLLSFFAMMCWNRYFIYDLGFQMSFLAIYMLIQYGDYGKKYISGKNKWLVMFLYNLYINGLITLGLVWHSLLLEGEINILSPLINTIAIPIFMMGLVAFLLGLCPIAGLCFQLLEWMLHFGSQYGIHIYGTVNKKYFNFYIYLFIIILHIINYYIAYISEKNSSYN